MLTLCNVGRARRRQNEINRYGSRQVEGSDGRYLPFLVCFKQKSAFDALVGRFDHIMKWLLKVGFKQLCRKHPERTVENRCDHNEGEEHVGEKDA